MEFLRKELLGISNAIRKMMGEQRYNTNYYLLRTIPCIGPLTAASILIEIGDVKRFDTFYHLNSFVGLLPMEHSSGQSENKLSLTVRNTGSYEVISLKVHGEQNGPILQWRYISRNK